MRTDGEARGFDNPSILADGCRSDDAHVRMEQHVDIDPLRAACLPRNSQIRYSRNLGLEGVEDVRLVHAAPEMPEIAIAQQRSEFKSPRTQRKLRR
jgi:hypothetical protein